MTRPVKTRSYRSPIRAAQADDTRLAILAAAQELFISEGYGATVAAIAAHAGVAVDTVYASVGRKPDLVRAVIDMVLGSSEEPIPAEQRDYVRRIQAAATARDKIETYADALTRLLPLLAPLQQALRQAGQTDPHCAHAWRELVDRRAARMVLLTRELRRTGDLRADLDDQHVADIIWATNSAEYFELLTTQRGWSPRQLGNHLIDLWTRTLLGRVP